MDSNPNTKKLDRFWLRVTEEDIERLLPPGQVPEKGLKERSPDDVLQRYLQSRETANRGNETSPAAAAEKPTTEKIVTEKHGSTVTTHAPENRVATTEAVAEDLLTAADKRIQESRCVEKEVANELAGALDQLRAAYHKERGGFNEYREQAISWKGRAVETLDRLKAEATLVPGLRQQIKRLQEELEEKERELVRLRKVLDTPFKLNELLKNLP